MCDRKSLSVVQKVNEEIRRIRNKNVFGINDKLYVFAYRERLGKLKAKQKDNSKLVKISGREE